MEIPFGQGEEEKAVPQAFTRHCMAEAMKDDQPVDR
jgi:hypothetical protein